MRIACVHSIQSVAATYASKSSISSSRSILESTSASACAAAIPATLPATPLMLTISPPNPAPALDAVGLIPTAPMCSTSDAIAVGTEGTKGGGGWCGTVRGTVGGRVDGPLAKAAADLGWATRGRL